MNFECFVFDEFGIDGGQRKIIDNVVQEIFKAQTFNRLLKSEKIKNVEFSLVLVENQKAKILNNNFRNKNKIPDILSFPFNEQDKNKTILGDIIITPSEIKKNYKNIQSGYQKLLIHGLLHLLGFDHVKNADFKKMNSLETNIFQELNN
ncbi:MAG: rRNA maturation RNase YbeY [Candidatus Paceibacterota bacterium]